jgi:hypothetical protein
MEKEDDSKIEWGKMTRNIQYKDAPSTSKNDVPAPTGWPARDGGHGRAMPRREQPPTQSRQPRNNNR